MMDSTCVENGVLFPVRKRTLQQGIYNIKSEYIRVNTFQNPYIHYLIRIFPRHNQHNSMSISCELMPWHQLWQQLIRRYQLTTVAEKYINQTTVNSQFTPLELQRHSTLIPSKTQIERLLPTQNNRCLPIYILLETYDMSVTISR